MNQTELWNWMSVRHSGRPSRINMYADLRGRGREGDTTNILSTYGSVRMRSGELRGHFSEKKDIYSERRPDSSSKLKCHLPLAPNVMKIPHWTWAGTCPFLLESHFSTTYLWDGQEKGKKFESGRARPKSRGRTEEDECNY